MAEKINERELILETLLMIGGEGIHSHLALSRVLDKYQYLSKSSRSFITRVVNGTLERQIELDHILNQFSRTKVNKMKPVIRMILRSSVYQMKYMDHVPDSAVVNEAVKLAQKKGFHGLKGFVNGVLRNISRNIDQIVYPDRSDTINYISVTCSLPKWLVEFWLLTYDEETVLMMGQAFLAPAKTYIRRNTARIGEADFEAALKRDGVTFCKTKKLSYAYELTDFDHLSAMESFRNGYFYVQDLSSMQVAEWAEVKPNDTVLDVCAAPGGKAIHIAEKLAGKGTVIARDLTPYKVDLIRENVSRSGLSGVEVLCHDARIFDETMRGKADVVIADLPCSGLGIMGRKPDLKQNVTREGMMELAALQREILSVVKEYVKPGGALIYSTCTINREENEANAAWFLQENPDFILERQLQMLPGLKEGDGFYIARFVKNK